MNSSFDIVSGFDIRISDFHLLESWPSGPGGAMRNVVITRTRILDPGSLAKRPAGEKGAEPHEQEAWLP